MFCEDMQCFFFFQAEDGIRDIGVTGVQTCALPICPTVCRRLPVRRFHRNSSYGLSAVPRRKLGNDVSNRQSADRISGCRYRCYGLSVRPLPPQDRKSTRLNSSHANISYAVFCLKKKKKYK